MNDGLRFWQDEVERLDKRIIRLEVALGDALSAFNNEEGKTTIVNEERLETWEEVLNDKRSD
jgi:hypothetical protein